MTIVIRPNGGDPISIFSDISFSVPKVSVYRRKNYRIWSYAARLGELIGTNSDGSVVAVSNQCSGKVAGEG